MIGSDMRDAATTILQREQIMSSDYIQVDESTLPVIDNEKHHAVKGYM